MLHFDFIDFFPLVDRPGVGRVLWAVAKTFIDQHPPVGVVRVVHDGEAEVIC